MTNQRAIDLYRVAAGAATEPVRAMIGHWTDREARTGCSVVLFDQAARAVVDVRGGAPGTRETDLLGPGQLVQHVDAILLAGGSAFGLAAADGVMRWLAERGRGVATPAGPVPIVASAILFDLGVGRPVAPDAAAGRAACEAAVDLSKIERGRVGVGAGATTGKIVPGRIPTPGGFGLATISWDDGVVTAVVAVNAAGIVDRADVPGSGASDEIDPRRALLAGAAEAGERTSTTLCVVLIAAPADERALRRCAVAAHDGFARRIRPCHTIYDGDVVFASALREGDPSATDVVRIAAATELAVEAAILDAMTE